MAHLRRALALVLSAATTIAACAGWSPPPAVSIAGSATDAASKVLVAVEEAQGAALIDAGKDPEPTLAKWELFWAAWRAWIAAQHAWADAYERGDSTLATVEASARAAFCKASSSLPAGVPLEVIGGVGIACTALPEGPVVVPVVDAGADGGAR